MATGPLFDHNTVFEIDGRKVKIAPDLTDLSVTGMPGDPGFAITATRTHTFRTVQDAIVGGALVEVHEALSDQEIPPDGSPIEWAFDGGPTMAEYDDMDAQDYQEMRDAGQLDD